MTKPHTQHSKTSYTLLKNHTPHAAKLHPHNIKPHIPYAKSLRQTYKRKPYKPLTREFRQSRQTTSHTIVSSAFRFHGFSLYKIHPNPLLCAYTGMIVDIRQFIAEKQ